MQLAIKDIQVFFYREESEDLDERKAEKPFGEATSCADSVSESLQRHVNNRYQDIIWNLSLIALIGQTIYQQKGTNDELRYIDLEATSGTFILKIVSTKANCTKKLVITDK